MRKLDCTEAEKLIIRDLDRSPDPQRNIDLEAHLRECGGCRRFRQEMGSILSEIAADRPPDPGEHYWANYHVSLEARLAEREPQPRWDLMWKAVGALAAAGLACVVIWIGTFESGPQPLTDQSLRLALIDDLNSVYGPTNLENGPTGEVAGQVVDELTQEASGFEERYLGWFEVEDESNHLLL